MSKHNRPDHAESDFTYMGLYREQDEDSPSGGDAWEMEFLASLAGLLAGAEVRRELSMISIGIDDHTVVTVFEVGRGDGARRHGKTGDLQRLRADFAPAQPAKVATAWFHDLSAPPWDEDKVVDGVCWRHYPSTAS